MCVFSSLSMADNIINTLGKNIYLFLTVGANNSSLPCGIKAIWVSKPRVFSIVVKQKLQLNYPSGHIHTENITLWSHSNHWSILELPQKKSGPKQDTQE